MNAAGTSLLEVVFSMTLALIVSVGLARVTQACGRALSSITLHHQALSVARNILEGQIAAACSSPVRCPRNLRCSVTAVALEGATRVSVRIDSHARSFDSDNALATLTTVVRGSWSCS